MKKTKDRDLAASEELRRRKSKADSQGNIHTPHNLRRYLSINFAKALFIYRSQLIAHHNALLDKAAVAFWNANVNWKILYNMFAANHNRYNRHW